MNDQPANSESTGFPFWPGLLLILAFNLYLATEVHGLWRVKTRLSEQSEIVSKRIEQAQGQMAGARTWLTMLEGIANDLIELGKTDSDIRRIVDKYQIRRNQPVPLPSDKSKDKAAAE